MSRGSDDQILQRIRSNGKTDVDRVPYVVVVSDEEPASKKLTVTVRKKSQPNKPFKEQLTADGLFAAVKKEGEGKPFHPLYTPRMLSLKARYI